MTVKGRTGDVISANKSPKTAQLKGIFFLESFGRCLKNHLKNEHSLGSAHGGPERGEYPFDPDSALNEMFSKVPTSSKMFFFFSFFFLKTLSDLFHPFFSFRFFSFAL